MNPPATAASAVIPFRAMDDSVLPGGLQWGLAILVCLSALALILWLLRRRAFTPPSWARRAEVLIDVLETRAVGPQVQLVVVRYAGRRLLLSVGSHGTQCLRDDLVGEARQP